LLLKTVVNCNVASASVSLHTFSFMALYKFVFNFFTLIFHEAIEKMHGTQKFKSWNTYVAIIWIKIVAKLTLLQ